MVNIPAFSEEMQRVIVDKVEQLIQEIERTPKTAKWKLRAKVGTRVPWYNEVSDWG